MRKYAYIIAAMALTIAMGSICTACEKIEDMPERTQSNVNQGYYEMPDPVILNADETALINKIKEEYTKSISQ